MKRRCVSIVLTGLMLALGACSTNVVSPVPEVIRNATRGIVTIANEVGSLGTGFVVASDGLIATNYHIARKVMIFVILPSGKHLQATLVAKNEDSDLAILRVPAEDLMSLELRSTEAIVGEPVLVLGNPFGLGLTASAGIVSAIGSSLRKTDRIQTDAAINPGNSGGPLLDMKGKVIGIINGKTTIGHGVGFAASAESVKRLLKTVPMFR
ncbi:MAG: trypsin-like peptidase domain-containing protein [Nitrospirae bacterium]|nr:trypsin-like peptidase domain-containing protein [Nitrospirota bacterium]MDA1303046.1 trypsin-like peptidase domain-containing protein [Nitrospirota bacterium]